MACELDTSKVSLIDPIPGKSRGVVALSAMLGSAVNAAVLLLTPVLMTS